MSNQLQALVDQALENQPFECSYTREQWLKTFAGLIVQECANKVKDFYQEDEFTCYNAAEKIREHFGVEE